MVAVEVAATQDTEGSGVPRSNSRKKTRGHDGARHTFSDKKAKSFRYKDKLESKRSRSRPPWEDSDGNVVWPQSRIWVKQMLDSHNFEMAMGCVISVNMIITIVEVDNEAACYPLPAGSSVGDCDTASGKILWLWLLQIFMLLIYTAEMALRMYAERLAYFKTTWNCLDFVVVLGGWLGEFLRSVPALSFLRFLRTVRLTRLLRALDGCKELTLLVEGLLNGMRTIFFSGVLLFAMLTLWSVIMVEHVHPVNIGLADVYDGCTRCPRAFSSVMTSNLTLFQQIVTGDSWGTVSIPVIEAAPATAVFFVGIVVTVALGLMNLILAVIVERATDAREADINRKMQEKEEAEAAQKLEMFGYCQEIDGDNSGEICLEELMAAYDEMPGFQRVLNLLDVHKEDLANVFKLLDTDRSGSVSYDEFIEELHNIRTRDTRTMLTFLKLAISELHEKVTETDSSEKLMHELSSKVDKQEGALAAIQQGLEKLRSAGPDAEAPVDQEQRAGRHTVEGAALLNMLGKDTRELASLQNGIVARAEAQVQQLMQHSDWLGGMGAATSARPRPEAQKTQRMEEKLGRLRTNVDEVEKQLERSSAALARNTELLAGLSREIDYQPKDGQGQARPVELRRGPFDNPSRLGMPSPRVGHPPQKPVQRGGDDLREAQDRRPSASRGEEPLTCKCTGIEKGPRAQIAVRPADMR